MPKLYLALLHYPVINKQGQTIASAVTNLDLHDIARLTKTYNIQAFYVITPMEDQKSLVRKIVSHWTTGGGASYNPIRKAALETIVIKDSLEDALNDIRLREGQEAKTIVTCARNHEKSIGYGRCREMLRQQTPYLLIFGTAWGLSEDIISGADYILASIQGNTDYNHLSVRSAASIISDRLLADYE
ncbi:MAG: hypothetical protein BWK80_36415 [Desulfobacteraceae bacterium IS3]|nr:MAG: hypothetical protein BWK80_36415 [Desulfobacteraceae bacterium IS3]HAO22451.1 hypothetical protein [Desulfobacteraceae bacterium]